MAKGFASLCIEATERLMLQGGLDAVTAKQRRQCKAACVGTLRGAC